MARKVRYIKVCPKCKSPDVAMDKTNPLQPSLGMPALYICNKCGHSAYQFPEIPLSELEAFEEDVEEKHLSDTKKDQTPLLDPAYGNFEVRAFWKFAGPAVLVIGLLLILASPGIGGFFAVVGLFMCYITFFRKKGLKE